MGLDLVVATVVAAMVAAAAASAETAERVGAAAALVRWVVRETRGEIVAGTR